MQQDQQKQAIKYESVIPKGKFDDKFNKEVKDEEGNVVGYDIIADLKLIKTLDELREFTDKCKDKIIAVDTETTGLSYLRDVIVGFSVSLDSYSGIYVPIRHQHKKVTKVKKDKLDENGNIMLTKAGKPRQVTVSEFSYSEYEGNLDPKKALDMLDEMMLNARGCLLHNSEYDLNMIKKEGYDVMKYKTFDTMLLPYIYDPEARLNGLKPLTKWLLGRHVQDFSEVTGGEKEFQYTNPEESYVYAACHDKETEVLTENGWVLWKDYNGIDKLGTVDVNTGLFEYQKPVNITKYKYEGDMYFYKSNSVNFCVTPNHKMLVQPAQDVSRTPIWVEAQNMKTYEKFYYKPKGKKGGEDFSFTMTQGCTLTSNQMAKLTALVLADGYVKNRTKESRNCFIGVTLSIEKNFKEITEFLDSLPIKANYHKSTSSDKVRTWGFSDKALWTLLHPYCKDGSRNKFVPEFIKNMKTEDIKDFIHFYSITDGYLTHNSQYLYTTSDKMLGDLMELCLMAGYNPSYHDRPPKDAIFRDHVVKAENCATVHHIYFNYIRKSVGFKRYTNNLHVIPYNDYVYCAEVPNHTLITRRGGKVLISGNCDSANTFGVYEKLYPRVNRLLSEAPKVLKFNGKRYNVLQEDNKLVRAFVDYYGHVKLNVDRQAAIDYKELIEKETKETIEKIYTYFGIGPFSLSTGSKEFQEVMKKFHMETGAMTKTGKRTSYGKDGIKEMNKQQRILRDEIWPKLSKIFFVDSKIKAEGPANMEAYNLINFLKIYGKPYFKFLNLDKSVNVLNVRDLNNKPLDKMTFVSMLKEMYASEKKKLEILQAVLKYSSLMKALNSYVTKLTEVDECIMRYRLTGTKSCRLSSGNGSKNSKDKNDYYIDLNAQNLSKSLPKFYVAKKGNGEGNILGWEFTPVDDDYAHAHKEDEYIVEGFNQVGNVRSCIVAPKGRLIASLDYSSEESKVLTIQSNDPVMREGYLKGIDPHEVTAIALFGAENYNGKTRKLAKGVNFGFNYGMSYKTLSENLSIPIDEAKEIYDKYVKTYFVCMQWKQQQVDEMYKNHGKVFTIFGRPRQLLPWLKMGNDSGDNGIIKYAERSTISHLIQSCCGDIMRSDFMNLYNRFFKHRDPYIDFVSSVHDELNFSIQLDHITEYVKIIDDIMTIKYLDPKIPITTSIELGYSLGNLFPFVWSDGSRTELVPERAK